MTFRALDRVDPEVAQLIRNEFKRQSETLELIASENLTSPAILEALGTLLTNKYAEGYPGRRYYGGTGEVIDKIETLAVERAKQLFGADYVNVQPHSGSQANAAVYMAPVAGLVAGGAYPSPIPHAAITSTTTQKTLRGAWGAIILCRDDWQKAIDSAVFPGTQGGPLMHAIAAKAVCFGEALKPEFKQYAKQVVVNAKAMADRLVARGLRLVSGGTDSHLMLIDLRPQKRTGKQVQDIADTVGITLNRNSIPFDDASKFNPSGVRVGTPLVTTRGMGEGEMVVIADCIADLVERIDDPATLDSVHERALELCRKFPIPYAFD